MSEPATHQTDQRADHQADQRPWWRRASFWLPSRGGAVIVVLLTGFTVMTFWPRPTPGPFVTQAHGTVAGTSWAVLSKRTGSGETCLETRVAGVRRAWMCDQHWSRGVVRLWRGPLPKDGGSYFGRPSLRLLRLGNTDRTLVVSVLYRGVATLRAPGEDGVVLRTKPLPKSKFNYVAAVVDAARAKALQGYGPNGEPRFYQFVTPPCDAGWLPTHHEARMCLTE